MTSPALVPTSSAFRAVFVYDKDAPATVVASIATAWPERGEAGAPAGYIEYHVTCASPCSSDFPAQVITQKSGSIWGGHLAVSGTTTAWDCNLGVTNNETNDGYCYTTTLKSGEPIPTTGSYTPVETCQVLSHSRMMFVTAGFDEFFKVDPADSRSPDFWMTYMASVMDEAKCTKTATPTATPTGSTTPTPTASSKGASATGSQSTASPTPGKSAASKVSTGSVLLVCMLVWATVQM
ncbi:hypothetical protein NLG97_g1945 [Lecanicillium saksenae]|uniref:Uncharacterized protein n=1 Tax=Lecanicillium saksenae TaxID=468837 RepID=A0ACC1R298_9HYPO|nr:hypothetical protein NLG97_g1945 [Lecanicillium saksenae]